MRMVSGRQLAAAASGQGAAELGDLPEWNLADLYSGMEAPELKRDIAKAAADAISFESRWKGTLAAEAERGSAGRLGEALGAYEALEELIGRIVSYAGLVYAGNTADPQRAKLYGDIQEKMTDASAHLSVLRARTEPDRRCRDREARSPPIARFAHYRPWVLDLRMDKPYQLEDRVEQLFHEKSITGRGAWNRLFDETMTDLALRHRRRGTDAGAGAEPPAGRRRRGAPPGLRGAGRNLPQELAHLHADHQHAGQGQGDFRPLARLRGHRRFAPSRQPRRAQRRRCAGLCRSRRLSAPVAPLLCDEGALARHGGDEPLGPQRAVARDPAGDHRLGRGQEHGAVGLSALFARHGGDRQNLLRPQLDRRAGAAGQVARRLRPSDRAVGASLCTAQLHGQAARCDDAGARARPWRASGAGRRPGRA